MERRAWSVWRGWGKVESRREDSLSARVSQLLIPLRANERKSLAVLPTPQSSGTEVIGGVSCDIVVATSPARSVRSATVTKFWIDPSGGLRRITRTYSFGPSKFPTDPSQYPPRTDRATIDRMRQAPPHDVAILLDIQPEFNVPIARSETEFTPPSP